jgi:hypothetical protein
MSLHAGLQIQECGAKPTQVYAQKKSTAQQNTQKHET